jgi:hypothetical protein
MSLDVPTALIEKAEHGEVDDVEFVACVRSSLPYAWTVVEGVARDLHAGALTQGGYALHTTPPSTEAERGQLLRALASDAIRGALERHLAVRLAFQNCHHVAAFSPGPESDGARREFVSVRSQILAQTPALRDC